MKEKTYNYSTIKIKQIDEITGTKNNFEKKTKMYCADIIYPYGSQTSFCKTTLKKLFKEIKEQMYL